MGLVCRWARVRFPRVSPPDASAANASHGPRSVLLRRFLSEGAPWALPGEQASDYLYTSSTKTQRNTVLCPDNYDLAGAKRTYLRASYSSRRWSFPTNSPAF